MCIHESSGVNADEPEENIVNVRENRLTGIVVHVCMGASLLLLPMIDLIPIPVTNGLFLYMGLMSLTGNQFVERCNLDFPETHFHEQYSDEAIYI
jgi:hypothetical protein